MRATGPGAGLMRTYLDRAAGEGSGGGLVGDFMVDGLIGPVIDIPALVAAM